ncbi:MAG TPA: hypothetical protein EYP14_13600 [Planctomycetaceae bacterium]|nr:hypothetical protein [Planctomycetaceae bacterium]
MAFWGPRAKRIGRELAWRLATPELGDAFQQGLPPGWLVTEVAGVVCRPDRKARTGRQSLQLHIGPAGTTARVWQPVFLPLHRQSAYEWSIWVRSEKATQLTVRLRSAADGNVHAEQNVAIAPAQWKKYAGRLKLSGEATAYDEPLHWEIELTGPATVWIDQCLLFPVDHQDGWDPEIVRLIRESRLPLLRWPGGNFASGYHWKDGIGHLDDRPMRRNRPWNMPEPNHVGTDEFMQFCELVGAEPMICVNAGDGTPHEAADWVEYCNGPATSPMGKLRAANGHPDPYRVRYWEIGNELYGSWQIGHCTAEEYAERYRRFAEAMKGRDPSIRLIATGNNQRWNRVLVERCADILQRVSLHTLIGGGISPQADPQRVWWSVVGYPWAYRHQIQALSGQLRRRVPNGTIAITELQIFTNRPRLPNNAGIAEALFWAGIVHTAIRSGDRVELITHSALVNHGGGLRKVRQRVFPNPVYWARRMYSTQSGRWPVAVRLEGPAFSTERLHNLPSLQDAPVVDVMALADDSRRTLSLLVLNRHADATVSTEFRFEHFTPAATARWQCLTGPDILAANSRDEPDRVRVKVRDIAVSGRGLRLPVPPRSVSVITLPARS